MAAWAQQGGDELVESARAHWHQIEQLAAERAPMPEGIDRDVQTTRIARIARTLRSEIGQLVNRIEETEAAGTDASADRAAASEILDAASTLMQGEIDHRIAAIAKRQGSRDEGSAEEQLELEQEITRDSQDLDESLSTLLQIAQWKQELSLDASGDFAYLDKVLEDRADDLMARTELALSRRNDDTKRLASTDADGKAPIQASLQAARESLHGSTTSLEATIALMDTRNLDTTEAKELLIRATGSVTSDIFDLAVVSGLLTRAWEGTLAWLSTNGPSIFFTALLVIFILGVTRILAGVVRKIATRTLGASDTRVPQLLKNMIISMSGKLVMVLGVIVALSQIGIDIAPLLAGVGVAGFIVGFALQDTLSNFASGVMILFYHPFDIGDVVEAGGVSGYVHHMSLVSTTIRTFDNQILIVPNNKIWGDVIRNKTSVTTRRVDLTFGIGYDDDIAHAERVLREIVDGHELVLDDPPPTIKLHELGDSSVNFVVRPWVKTPDYWAVYWDVTRAVKERFDAEGISIPFPQRDVHHHGLATPETVTGQGVVPSRADIPERVTPSGVSAEDD